MEQTRKTRLVAEIVAPGEALERVAEVWDPTTACPLCDELFVHVVPAWANKTKGLAYPALLMHYIAAHPWVQPPPPGS